MEKKLSNKVITSCFLAACLEMYDFSIFGFFTVVLYNNYFSFLDEKNALIISYAIFAVGFVFRPIGSIIFGYIGDIYGRKKALILSVSLMGTASLAMAILPSYALIGIISCYIIAFIRVLQGISVGGEYSGAIIYAVEHFSKENRGAVGGVVISGAMMGALLATIISRIVQNPVLPDYSWRFSFLLGFGLSIIGYFIRKKLVETPEFINIKVNKKHIPLIEGVKKHPMKCFCAVLMAAANGINFYFILVFLPQYINKITGSDFNYYPMISTIILIILSPMFSVLSDKIQRSTLISYGLLVMSVYTFLGLNLITIYPSFISAILFFCGHAIIYSTQAATVNIFIVEIFPTRYRFSCASLCYSLGIGVIGGTSPLVASLLVDKFHDGATFYISCYMSTVCLLAYFSILMIRRIRNDPVYIIESMENQ